MSLMKSLFMIIRPNFLLLVPVCVFAGIAGAYYATDSIQITYLILAFIGALFAHISVNVFNVYFDFKSGIDFNTKRTPFSGGSPILTSGMLQAGKALLLGIISLAVVAAIGVYFIVIYKWAVLPIGLCGMVIIYLYTPYITKIPVITELIGPGLGFGLMVLGVYFTQTGGYSSIAIVVTLISGLLVANLLLLNEFPDVEADSAGGRKHLPVVIGRGNAAKIYCLITAAVYALIIVASIADIMPYFALLGLLTLPLGFKAAKGALKYHSDINNLVPYMAANVMFVLLTPLLVSTGIILDKVIFK